MRCGQWTKWIGIAFVCIAPAASAWGHGGDAEDGGPIRVMTQNLYLGADLLRIVTEPDPQLIPVRVAETLAIINATDFPARAQKIAKEIERAHPDVIGLQEVSLLRTQFPGDFLLGNPVAANDVLYDYLDILLDALRARGLHYRVAAIVANADVEVPALTGTDPQGNPLFMDVRLTDHDVILTRRGVPIWNATAENYQTNLQIPLGSDSVEFTRGYVAVTAKVRDRIYRVVNTHLELPGPAPVSWIQSLQAAELISAFWYSRWPVVMLGDFNSAPEDSIDSSGAVPPYLQLTLSNFVDVWPHRRGSPQDGYTCCQDERLDNPTSALSTRIDHVFVRSRGGDPTVLDDANVHAWTVGDKPWNRTRGGLWPSDHAGVVARLRLPSGN